MRQRLGKYSFIIIMVAIYLLPSCSIQQRIKRADKKFAIGEYFIAADIYKQCYGRLSMKKDRELKGYVAYQQGECYRKINSPRAYNSYRSAIRCKYQLQDSTVYLHAAQVMHYQGKYKDASKHYSLYLESHPDDYVAQAGLYACNKIEEWRKEHSRYKLSEAKIFNQRRSSNFAPMFIGDQTDALMFTSNRQEKQKGTKKVSRPSNVTGQQLFQLYQTRKNAAGEWEEIELAEGLYGESESENSNDSTSKQSGTAELGVCCFSQDGRTMYFTYSKPINGQDLGAKIYKSERASGEWGEAQEVKLFADSSITCGHPALTSGGDTLYFVSDAPGGIGGKDIWMAFLDDDNQWAAPTPLGAGINTTSDEMYPYVHADGTLYFASNGHPGYGGLDIYKAVRDTTQKDTCIWVLYNMGSPFNSNGDDFGITFAGDTQDGFFSSNRKDKKGYDKIYQFWLPEMVFSVEGIVTDEQGNTIADARLRIVGSDGTNSKINARKDGTYKIKLKRDVRYVMLATARGYLNAKEQWDTKELKDSKAFEKNFTLSPISRPVKMENVFYAFGSWELTEQSEKELQQLVKLLQDNPNITIELSAHTDLKGNDQFNQELSQKRAQSCCDYLVAHGIEKERLTPVGYGKHKPVVADKALHTKYNFIPQEQVLDETFILTLTEEQQEICNQINRRTEFKVIKTTYNLY